MFGTVTAVVRAKGFGFIRGEDGQDRFFHARSLVGIAYADVEEGLRVQFDSYQVDPAPPQPGKPSLPGNGLRARDVQAVEALAA